MLKISVKIEISKPSPNTQSQISKAVITSILISPLTHNYVIFGQTRLLDDPTFPHTLSFLHRNLMLKFKTAKEQRGLFIPNRHLVVSKEELILRTVPTTGPSNSRVATIGCQNRERPIPKTCSCQHPEGGRSRQRHFA
ncbi:hypothetical protein AVEN_247849-1 [Araneus ventricosus]|uniref:Uncharacterized protein n=1 Tax=Araneus ventricosus TaxID=182803 RepID=A0A4Y2IER0_ARAVE|nr:hypothetical protein AVEN_247849-1 [Araneus ventricosus]